MEGPGRKTAFGKALLLSGVVAAFASLALASSASAAREQTTFFTIAPASHARAMTAGPDGNLWFVATKSSSVVDETIGRLTPGGEVTEFPLPARSYEANVGPDIVAGPDGNLWFVEYGGKRLGRISPAGDTTEFPLPGVDSRASAIASGPDGALWFTDEAASKIGRLDGAITEFPLPPGAGPAGSRRVRTATSGSPRRARTRSA
jgi:virginiamycin B lyase